MAEFNSVHYAAAYVDHPAVPGNSPNYVNVYGADIKYRRFTYTQSGAGTIGDSIRLVKVPANSIIVMPLCRFQFTAWGVGALLDIGWDAHTDVNGEAVAADPDGLLVGLDVAAVGEWVGGLLITAGAVARAAPALEIFEVNSREEVTIRATNRAAAAGDADQFNGWIAYAHT